MINYLNLLFLKLDFKEREEKKSLYFKYNFRSTLYTLTFDIELMSRYQWRFPFLQLLFLTSYVSLR